MSRRTATQLGSSIWALLRTWGGIVDICPDASPIIDGPRRDCS